MNHLDRLNISGEILESNLPLMSQWDQNVIEDNQAKIEHPWIEQLMSLNDDDLYFFDGQRQDDLLLDESWQSLISKIKRASTFDNICDSEETIHVLGNKKKQHELNRLYSALKSKKDQSLSAVDFGGGVGNLARFLEEHLGMKPTVLEQNIALIEKGRTKLSQYGSHIEFSHCEVCSTSSIPILKNRDIAIGLHTCGGFANDMLNQCIQNKVSEFINFGCCYSKIENNEYHLNKKSLRHLEFNQRALTAATLSFGKVSKELYSFRLKIMKYKYSFYHWLYKEHGLIEFRAMSNSRRTLYDQSFYEFVKISLEKYFPGIPIPTEKSLSDFYECVENTKFNKYLNSYYAIARYLGEILEVYILSDRALYTEEYGYKTNILNVFDHSISPRNKGLFSTLDKK